LKRKNFWKANPGPGAQLMKKLGTKKSLIGGGERGKIAVLYTFTLFAVAPRAARWVGRHPSRNKKKEGVNMMGDTKTLTRNKWREKRGRAPISKGERLTPASPKAEADERTQFQLGPWGNRSVVIGRRIGSGRKKGCRARDIKLEKGKGDAGSLKVRLSGPFRGKAGRGNL